MTSTDSRAVVHDALSEVSLLLACLLLCLLVFFFFFFFISYLAPNSASFALDHSLNKDASLTINSWIEPS